MVDTPIRPNIDNVDHDTPAREYIASLLQGVMPDPRPDDDTFGPWASTITNLEVVFYRVSDKKDVESAAQQVQETLSTLSKTNPALAELMKPAPTLDDIIDNVDETFMPPLPEQCRLDPALARGACHWLDTYEAFSKEASPEGYDDFHAFAGLWALSVVNARRSYIPFGHSGIHGNLMIAFCARTSLYKKSTTANVAKDIIRAAGLGYLLGPNKISPAKLLSDMSGSRLPADIAKYSVEDQEYLAKKLGMSGQRGFYFDEFGKFLQAVLRKNSTTADFADLFLELDDSPSTYENATIARSGEPIKNPYLPILGSMTPTNLKESGKSGADWWGEGLFGRYLFITPPEGTYKDCPLSFFDIPIPPELVQKLQAWHKRLGVPQCYIVEEKDKDDKPTGEFVIEREDLQATECTVSAEVELAWKRYYSGLKSLLPGLGVEDFNASYGRLPIIAMRMALLMASLENDNKIEMRHWARAQQLAETARKGLHELYRQVNSHDYESESKKLENGILERLRLNKEKGVDGITVAQLSNRFFKSTSAKMLVDVVESMTKAGLLTKETNAHAKQGKYFLVD